MKLVQPISKENHDKLVEPMLVALRKCKDIAKYPIGHEIPDKIYSHFDSPPLI